MQQFRVVILDDYDNVIEVEYESEIFISDNIHDKSFNDAQFDQLCELDSKYNLNDYENAPIMEFQRRCTDKKGEWSDWEYLSDPIVDWYNI